MSLTKTQLLNASLISLLVWMAIGALWFEATHAEAMPPRIVPPPYSDVQVVRPGGEAVFTYDAKDLRLVIGAHAPRTLLICIHDICDLADGWRLK